MKKQSVFNFDKYVAKTSIYENQLLLKVIIIKGRQTNYELIY